MVWPPYISATCPFSAPSAACCCMKNFCERLAMTAAMTMLSGSVRTMPTVSIQLMLSIITITPTSVSTDVSSCVRFCCRVPLMLSRSLTARLITSPRVRESKNFSGRRSNFASTSWRSV